MRYEGNDGSRTPNLVNRKTNTSEAFFGKLCTLIVWHALDPVSNQDIDHPEFVMGAGLWRHAGYD